MPIISTDKRIRHRIHHRRPDALTVRCVLVGARLDVDFFEDRVAWRAFEGGEDVFDDLDWLFTLAEGGEPGARPRVADQEVADANKVLKLLGREEFRK